MADDVYVMPLDGKVRVDAGGLISPWDAATLGRKLLAAAALTGQWEPCKFCGGPMLWARTERRAGMPLSIGASDTGTLAAWRHGGTLWVRACSLRTTLRPGEQRVITHFSDCLKYAEHTGAQRERALLEKLSRAEADGTLVAQLERLFKEADRVRGYPLPRKTSGRRDRPAAGGGG